MADNSFQPITQSDFSGGVNAVSSPYLIGQKQLARARNLLLDEHGSLTTRDGFSVITTSPDTVSPIIYMGVLNKTDLSSIRFAIQQNDGVNQVYRSDTDPWTLVGSLETGYLTPQSVTMTNTEVIAAGYERPKIFDGNTLTPITAAGGQTVPPGAKHASFHLGSLWLWNTSAGTTSLDGPSSVRMSDPNNYNSWPNANQTFISKDDGQVGMGLASFTIAETGISPTQTLVAFKNLSAYQILGIFGSTNFSIQRVKGDMGCIAPRTIQFVSGYGIFRLTHKGLALFNGVDDRLISEEIRPYIFGHGDIIKMNPDTIDRSWAVQSQNPPLYILAGPVGGSNLTRVLVYDLIRKSWTICDFPIPFQSLSLISTSTTFPVIHAGTSTSGRIVRLFAEDTTDDGEEIEWSFRTRSYHAGSPTKRTFWRRVLLDMVFTPGQEIQVDITAAGFAQPQNIFRTLMGTELGERWGEATWGEFLWGPDMVEGRTDVDILRTAPSVYITVTGAGNVVVRSLDLHVTPKPLTRAVT